MFNSLDSRVYAWLVQGAVEDAIELFEDDVVDQRAFARAGDAGDASEQPEGNAHLDVFEVVLARPFDDQPLAVAATALAGDRDSFLARKIAAREGLGAVFYMTRRAKGD